MSTAAKYKAEQIVHLIQEQAHKFGCRAPKKMTNDGRILIAVAPKDACPHISGTRKVYISPGTLLTRDETADLWRYAFGKRTVLPSWLQGANNEEATKETQIGAAIRVVGQKIVARVASWNQAPKLQFAEIPKNYDQYHGGRHQRVPKFRP